MTDSLNFIYDVNQAWIVAGMAAIYLIYYITKVKKPMLVCACPRLRKFATRHMPSLGQMYWPTIWCVEGRLQTLVKSILNMKCSVKLNYRREIISTSDNGEICLDWIDDDRRENLYRSTERPTVILIPGISGSSAEGYAVQMVESVQRLGYRAVVFNSRGLGGSSLKTPRTFCVNNTDDLRTVVCHIKSLYPQAPLMAAGASAGGITLFHYLCNFGNDCGLKGAVFASVLYDMFASTKSLESFPNEVLFNNTLTSSMVENIVVSNLPMLRHNKKLDINHILKSRTIRQFHIRLTVPMFGHSDWETYYRECNLVGNMHRLRVPTLFVSAADDPFAPLSSIPVEEMKQDNILLVVTCSGGHAGFCEGFLPQGHSFLHKVFSQFVDAIFKHGDEELPGKVNA